jgi:hypothetical protein
LILSLESVATPDLPRRDDALFQHLRDIAGLGDLLGRAVRLPVFPELPKGFTKAVAQQVLITPARLALLQEAAAVLHLGQENVENDSRESGFILSGPNGVGKSVDSYLLAAFLYLNGSIVAYIVLSLCYALRLLLFVTPLLS